MNAGQAIELAKEWVELQGSQMEGFCGAHLMGSLTYTPAETPFPDFKDVDLNLVVQSGPEWDVHDISYKGRILEYGVVGVEAYRSPEAVLGDARLASNLAVNSILSDPTGLLNALFTQVSREYKHRKWVIARCENEKSQVLKALAGLSQSGSPNEALFHASLLVMGLSGLVALASLNPPTHRRGLILMRQSLTAWGRAELLEDTLALYGCAGFSRAQVESYLPNCALAFDRAVEVTRTPVPFGFKLHSFVRPYFTEGAREMLAEGSPREAMLWIVAFLLIPNNAIQADAPEAERPLYQAKVDRLARDMGWKTPQSISRRSRQAKILVEALFQASDEALRRNQALID